MLPLGTTAPAFKLPDTEGRRVGLDDFPGSRGYLVMFICNHCPFVKHLRSEIAALTEEYMANAIAVVAINSNDIINYPEDRPEMMAKEKREQNYKFPYLFDESQTVAKAFDAACTPDFYLFDSKRKLVYRGQFDSSRPGNNIPVTGEDLKNALEALLAGQPPLKNQRPSLGCNIKWKEEGDCC
jgi:peroxiredoxin